MNTTKKYFEENGYVVLKEALTSTQCAQLVDHMFDLHKQGKLTSDDQCPLSDSIYGDPIFENLLYKFAKPIGNSVGKELIPTYAYSRIYRTGEVLKRHKDRPACEISATLTLGYKANKVWPIFFDEEKEIYVDLEVGEMAIYKGCDIVHWRPSFKGDWHVQVFLHYVDANGPYNNHAKDNLRKSLEIKSNENRDITNSLQESISVAPQDQQKKPKLNDLISEIPFKLYNNGIVLPTLDVEFPGYICLNQKNLPELVFTPQECIEIINLKNGSYPISASVGGTLKSSKIQKSIRSADIYSIEYEEKTKWIFEKLMYAVCCVNANHFDYEIFGVTHSFQLIRYSVDQEIKGHYNWHIDSGNGEPATRKISVTCQLSDPRNYTGCELVINNHTEEVIATKEQGSIHMFPSYMPHTVKPIISGERYALVVWVHGSRRFR